MPSVRGCAQAVVQRTTAGFPEERPGRAVCKHYSVTRWGSWGPGRGAAVTGRRSSVQTHVHAAASTQLRVEAAIYRRIKPSERESST